MTLARIGRPTKLESQRRQSIAKQRASGNVSRREKIPEWLEQSEINGMIQAAPLGGDGIPSVLARLFMLSMWRGGLRISEALSLDTANFRLNQEMPTIKVLGKGNKERAVPVHPEWRTALINFMAYNSRQSRVFPFSRTTGWRIIKESHERAEQMGLMVPGRLVTPHTFRHSAARHWLASGVPINMVSVWLGHASLQTTLIYLRILPDAAGNMERVP